MSLSLRPISIAAALAWCASVHRRLPRCTGGMWAVAVRRDGALVGVAIVARPARLLDNGLRLQVSRVAVLEGDVSATGQRGACSMLYAACARAARQMGASDMMTYIHHDEPGTSLRAAGWIEDTAHVVKGGTYDRPSRRRAAPVEGGRKVRWFAPWSEMATPSIAHARLGVAS